MFRTLQYDILFYISDAFLSCIMHHCVRAFARARVCVVNFWVHHFFFFKFQRFSPAEKNVSYEQSKHCIVCEFLVMILFSNVRMRIIYVKQRAAHPHAEKSLAAQLNRQLSDGFAHMILAI
jgi:hypothetical protein